MSIPDLPLESQAIFDALRTSHDDGTLAADEWRLILIHRRGSQRLYQAAAAGQPSLAVKCYTDSQSAVREFAVLGALREFGINLAPSPIALDAELGCVIMSWLDGEPFTAAPPLDDDARWQQIMASFGAAGAMRLDEFSRQVPMAGYGCLKPSQLFEQMRLMLEKILPSDPAAEPLWRVYEHAIKQVPPDWNRPAPIGLCRRNYALRDLLWDGHHLLAVDWEHADWGDLAAEIGFWSAHPDYERVPAHHWVWVRWEFARLTHDSDLVARATSYGHLAQLYWAINLTVKQPEETDLRDRYLQRAKKVFRA